MRTDNNPTDFSYVGSTDTTIPRYKARYAPELRAWGCFDRGAQLALGAGYNLSDRGAHDKADHANGLHEGWLRVQPGTFGRSCGCNEHQDDAARERSNAR